MRTRLAVTAAPTTSTIDVRVIVNGNAAKPCKFYETTRQATLHPYSHSIVQMDFNALI
jgi:hypothetical protein